jgi:hypothetical protein
MEFPPCRQGHYHPDVFVSMKISDELGTSKKFKSIIGRLPGKAIA